MRALLLSAICFCAPLSAMADTALILANSRYDSAQNLRFAGGVAGLETPLTEAGFDVIVVENGPVDAMRAGVEALLEAEEDERVFIFAAGHMAHSDGRNWVLGRDAARPNLATVDGQGVSVDTLLASAGRAPGQAVVFLATEARRMAFGPGVAPGIGTVEPPQGVTVLAGPPQTLTDLARDVALRPGGDLAGAAAAARNVEAFGFLSPAVSFLPSDPQPEAPTAGGPSPEEQALWDAADELDTPGAYRAYLNQYPGGAFAAEARERIAAIEENPLLRAEEAEQALGLDRRARQEVQRALSLLDYDTRGIDGIFGPGTRGAIRGWQTANGREATGFLSAEDLPILRQQAATRAAVLAEEARLRQLEQDRADRAYWQALGQGRSEAALRQYLERYPDGLFSDVAEERLAEIEAARRAEAEASERADWDAVRAADTVGAYQQYLDAYPEGLFREIAEARIEELRGGGGLTPEERAQAQAREAALNLQPVMRLMVERRLASLGLEPGRLDGEFDRPARRAIRRYQGARGLTATGYLDQPTVVRLLAEAIGGRIVE